MPGRWDCRLSVPLPDLPSALAGSNFSHPTTSGNSANSFRQYPASGLLPQIQGEQGGAEGRQKWGLRLRPPCWSSPRPPALGVSGSNLRFPPALKIAYLPPQFPWQRASRLGILSGP